MFASTATVKQHTCNSSVGHPHWENLCCTASDKNRRDLKDITWCAANQGCWQTSARHFLTRNVISLQANPPKEEVTHWVNEVCGSDTWARFMPLHAPWRVVSITLTERFQLPVLIQIIKQECVVFGWPQGPELSLKAGILKVFHDEVMCSPLSVYWLVGLSAGSHKIYRT